MKTIIFVVFLSIVISLELLAQTIISPNDSNIKFTGSFFNKVSDKKVLFLRHSDTFLSFSSKVSLANPEKAKTNTGVSIIFKTDASEAKVMFKMLFGVNAYNIYSSYYIDGDSIGVFKQNRNELTNNNDSTFSFTMSSPGGGIHTYKIVLSTWSFVSFIGLELTGESERLEETELPVKPVYVAYGNSITHGRGQDIGDQTYPWILAERMGWQLSNVAVGGSKLSVPMAEMIANEITNSIDFMTVLIGYNDGVGSSKDTTYFRGELIKFIDLVRSGHPETTIFVLGQTYTTTTENKNGDPIDFDDWRKVQKYVVDSLASRGDTKIYYINGADFTSAEDMNDKVHLNIRGASIFGNAIADTIAQILNPSAIFNKKDDRTKIDVFPNPVKDRIIITATPEELSSIQLFSFEGEKVSINIKSYNNNRLVLDTNALLAGMYILKSKNGVVKIIKSYY